MRKLHLPVIALAVLIFPLLASAQSMEFAYPDRDGKIHALSDYKGSYVVVDFWASWCVPCRKQTPYLKKFETENHYDNLVVMGVSMDDDEDAWKEAMDKDQPLGVQLINEEGFDSDLAEQLDIYGIPRFVLFGPDGMLVDDNLPQPSDDTFKSTVEGHLKTAR